LFLLAPVSEGAGDATGEFGFEAAEFLLMEGRASDAFIATMVVVIGWMCVAKAVRVVCSSWLILRY
jgi:hypothetical protein